MRFRDINGQQPAELELAPMIDVVFQLLIFFIVTWQYARFERDMDISVPSAQQAENRDRQAGEIIINVRKNGSVVLNGIDTSKDQLLTKLQMISKEYPDQAVILRGASDADFQAIINVLDVIKEGGIWNVAFATVKPE